MDWPRRAPSLLFVGVMVALVILSFSNDLLAGRATLPLQRQVSKSPAPFAPFTPFGEGPEADAQQVPQGGSDEKHLECQGQSCVSVWGAGANQCSTDSDCAEPPESHLECQGGACLQVTGAGTDECVTDGDCSHLGCQGQTCALIPSPGPDLCSTDLDCNSTTGSGPATHLTCENMACVEVPGDGPDTCNWDFQCVSTVCQDKACVKQPGNGTNQCSSSFECYGDLVIIGSGYNSFNTYDGSVTVLSSVDGEMLWETDTYPEGFGSAVNGVSDVNGDNFNDVVVGQYRFDFNNDSSPFQGRVYIFDGLSGTTLLDLKHEVTPEEVIYGWFGFAVSPGGDINNDKIGDILVTSPRYGTNFNGRVYALSGKDGKTLWTHTGVDDGHLGEGVIAYVSSLEQSITSMREGVFTDENVLFFSKNGNLLQTKDSEKIYLDISLGWVPDTSGDGQPDVLVGEPSGYTASGVWSEKGEVSVYSSSFSLLWSVPGEAEGDHLGESVSGVGDVNGDGYGDVIVGAPGYEKYNGTGYGTDNGKVYVFSGADGSLIWSREGEPQWGGPWGWIDSEFGWSVSGVHDINADGYGDVIVGDYLFGDLKFNSEDNGKVYAFSGNNGSLLWERKGAQKQYLGWDVKTVRLSASACGDHVCEGKETAQTCPNDCSITCAKDVLVAVGSGGKVFRFNETCPASLGSACSFWNITAWNETVLGEFGTGDIRAIAHNGLSGIDSLFALGGSFGKLFTSNDGVSWTPRYSAFDTDDIRDIVYGNGLWVAVGEQGAISTSADGISWTARQSGTTATLTATAYGGQWLAGGQNGQLTRSADGVVWTPYTPGTFDGGTVNDLLYTETPPELLPTYGHPGIWAAVTSSGKLSTSFDGIAWSAPLAVTGKSLQTLDYHYMHSQVPANPSITTPVWIAGNNAGKMFLSTNILAGLGPLQASNFGTSPIHGVMHNGADGWPQSLWIAVGNAGKVRLWHDDYYPFEDVTFIPGADIGDVKLFDSAYLAGSTCA
ncbi:MAG: FG-GAP repeat protein [Candidatus Aenigmarchaeota archaeon]|nr:FG-GAP repeat protein [Candidatus Aenigmarchaeota archaeon]